MKMIMILLIPLLLLSAGCADLAKKVDADIYRFDPAPNTPAGEPVIFRFVDTNDDGEPDQVEYLACSSEDIKQFIAMHKDDFNKWLELFKENCTCKQPASPF